MPQIGPQARVRGRLCKIPKFPYQKRLVAKRRHGGKHVGPAHLRLTTKLHGDFPDLGKFADVAMTAAESTMLGKAGGDTNLVLSLMSSWACGCAMKSGASFPLTLACRGKADTVARRSFCVSAGKRSESGA